ncbi:MAG: DUF3536 domain-containing protein [Candidatus Muirbacterium halophilum]|nr:DUF3536 domain-containing protein [Candidatus Muirbacterium halophilum]MCK9474875.1 DUF3536 domain-containing protein [Candidatus Muirbacterium halophilum]
MNKKLIIHGHFYQPPRENPWTGEIERQNGAEPYHDFNEKIAAECYTSNAFSKYLDGFGRILDIVNNYEYMSFNFGPTLLKWIEKKLPFTYKKIIQADKKSCEKFEGHGNAIAQVFNHVIMPLASTEDKITQIKWGIEDFKYHFKRAPEGMWLGETAINMETVSFLIDEGIKFTICSPFQAESIKKGKEEWKDVGDGSIPTGKPYRVYIEDKYLDIYFFDKNLSKAISFEHLLTNADYFRERILQCYAPGSNLVNVATDGETFGHHEPFGNMAMTALIKKAHESNIEFVNYAYYVAKNTPEYEVKLKKGDYGTAWSCSHGVGRWYRDCGCSTDGMDGWNQKWRTPLRDAFNYLSTEINEFCEDFIKISNKELLNLRNNYIKVINNKLSIEDFKKENSIEINKDILEIIMEIQKYSQYIFTSCAWFFADISRLEPVQNMKYALKTIELIKKLDSTKGEEIEKSVKIILSQGKSNIQNISDGRWIWDNYAKTSMISHEYFVLYAASLFILSQEKDFVLYKANINITKGSFEEINENCSIFDLLVDFENVKKEFKVFCNYENSKLKIYYSVEKLDFNKIKQNCSTEDELINFGLKPLNINSLFNDEKEDIKNRLLLGKYNELLEVYNNIYIENEDIIHYLCQSGMEIPDFLKIPASVYLQNELLIKIKEYMILQNNDIYKKILNISAKIKAIGLKIYKEEIFKTISDNILLEVNNLENTVNRKSLEKLINIIKMNNAVNIYVNVDHDKNIVFDILKKYCIEIEKRRAINDFEEFDFDIVFLTLNLAELLNINIDRFREKLNPFGKQGV